MINQAPPDDWDALPLNWRELIKEQSEARKQMEREHIKRMVDLIQKESEALVKSQTL
jgi:hypothetical protein